MKFFVRFLVSLIAAATIVLPVTAGVAAADGRVIRFDTSHSSGCDFQVVIEVFGGGTTLTITGDAPSTVTSVGDTSPASGSTVAGLPLEDGIYIIEWDGEDTGGEALEFSVMFAGQTIVVPVSVTECDDLASIEEEKTFLTYAASAPVVAPGRPSVGADVGGVGPSNSGNGGNGGPPASSGGCGAVIAANGNETQAEIDACVAFCVPINYAAPECSYVT